MSMKRRALRRRRLYDPVFAAVAERDGMRCRWCERAVRRIPPGFAGSLPDDAATLDHHPIKHCDGGPDTPDNLVMSCAVCNVKRGQRSGSAGPITEAELVTLIRRQA